MSLEIIPLRCNEDCHDYYQGEYTRRHFCEVEGRVKLGEMLSAGLVV